MTSPRADDIFANSATFKSWWPPVFGGRNAILSPREESPEQQPSSIFGAPLREALKYTTVPISLAKEDGEQYIWGYVPALVAKTGLFLKQNGTDVEGVFRITGSEKRMRDLQDIFDSAPNYGKIIDWSPFTVHDVAGVLRRYLKLMPEPIIPYNLFKNFSRVQNKADLDLNTKIEKFRLLIKTCPQANQYVLLYILDLLAVFERNREKTKMTAQNLAIVFQPSILNPQNLTSKTEHATAVSVIEFLITHQDCFVLGLTEPPPKDKRPEELTSSISPDVKDYVMIPSDSDEEVVEYRVHVGGGARLARSNTTGHGQASTIFARRERRKRAEQRQVSEEELRPPISSPDIAYDSNARQSPRLLMPTRSIRRRANSNTETRTVDNNKPPLKDNELRPTRTPSKLSYKMRDSVVNGNGAVPSRPPIGKRSVSATSVAQAISSNVGPYSGHFAPAKSDDFLLNGLASQEETAMVHDVRDESSSMISPGLQVRANKSSFTTPAPPISPEITVFPPCDNSTSLYKPMSYLQHASNLSTTQPLSYIQDPKLHNKHQDEPRQSQISLDSYVDGAYSSDPRLSSLAPVVRPGPAPMQTTTRSLSAGAEPAMRVDSSPISYLVNIDSHPKADAAPAVSTKPLLKPDVDVPTSHSHLFNPSSGFSQANGIQTQDHLQSSFSSSQVSSPSLPELHHAKVIITISGQPSTR